MRALPGFTEDHAAAVAALIAALEDDDMLVRVLAAEGLGTLGRIAEPARPALERVAGDPTEREEVRDQAKETLGRLPQR